MSGAKEGKPTAQPNYGSISATQGEAKEARTGMWLKPLFADRGYLMVLMSVPLLAFEWHWVSILCSLISAILCWALGYSRHILVDPMIFKAIYVVVGFSLGFRNVRANFRYGEALNHTKTLFGAAWSMITLFRDRETRMKVEGAMIDLLHCIADHLVALENRQDSVYGLVGLRPTYPEGASAADFWGHGGDLHEVEVQLAPRSLMNSVFVMAGNEICRIEPDPCQESKRTVWLLRETFFRAFENCELLTMPSVSRQFWTLITNVLFVFGVALPWGISGSGASQGLHDRAKDVGKDLWSRESLHSLAFICFNTLMCMVVLFGLNALAHENEQPFKGGAHETVRIQQLVHRFRDAVHSYEDHRDTVSAKVSKALPPSPGLSEDPYSTSDFKDNQEQIFLCAGKLPTIESAKPT